MIYIYEYKKKESKTKKYIYIYIIKYIWNHTKRTRATYVRHRRWGAGCESRARGRERVGESGREWAFLRWERETKYRTIFFLSVIPYPVPCEKTSFAIELYKRKHFSTLVSLLSTLVRTKITKPIPLCPIKISIEIFSSKFWEEKKVIIDTLFFLLFFFFF